MTTDLGHDEEIGAAFAAYDRLVRWEGHSPRLDATDPIHERAAARGHIVALIANLAAAQAGGGLRAALVEAQLALKFLHPLLEDATDHTKRKYEETLDTVERALVATPQGGGE